MSTVRYRSTFYYRGKRYECTGKSQKDADVKAALKLDKLERGEIGTNSNMRVEKWVDEWLEVYKRPVIGVGQYNNYKIHITLSILPAIGNKRLCDVTDMDAQKILNTRAGNSTSDIKKLNMTLKAIFERAVISRLIPYNPAAHLSIPAGTSGTHRSITHEERAAILELAKTHYSGLWVLTLLYTGMRPGETRALEWRHVDLSRKLIHIEQAAKAVTDKIDLPKSAAGIRDVPIPDVLFLRLQAAYGTGSVFVQPTTGTRHTTQSMRNLWESFKRELDIQLGATVFRNKIIESKLANDLMPYCLRHTYCTDLQDAGVPINIARYLMGHSDISVTAKIYTHTTDKAIKTAADMINALNI